MLSTIRQRTPLLERQTLALNYIRVKRSQLSYLCPLRLNDPLLPLQHFAMGAHSLLLRLQRIAD
jgi:hypothetical protein